LRTYGREKSRSGEKLARLSVQVCHPEAKIAPRQFLPDLVEDCGGGAVDRRYRFRI
jgi:hypothetical protein